MVNIRKAIESLYTGVCSILEYKEVKDEITKITSYEEVIILENQPCRISFKTIPVNNETETGATLHQTVKIFTSPDVVIKPGSKIIVTQNGVTTNYKNSGEPAAYSSHQEIMLELFKGWS